MSLFSWFTKHNLAKANQNCPDAIKQELKSFNNASMWPTAKARNTTVVKQQIFINETNNKNETKHKNKASPANLTDNTV